MSRLQFRCTILILRHAWLNLWDKHMTTGRINQVAAEIFFWNRAQCEHRITRSLGKDISSRLVVAGGFDMRPRMSFALVTFCITLLGGVCVQRKIFSCGGRRRRWALLHQHPFWFFFFQRGPSAHRPTCGGLCEDPELSVRTVWFEMNWFGGLKQTPSIHTTPAGCVNTTKNVDSLLRGDLAPGGWGRCPTIQRRAQRLRRKRLKSLSILLFLEDW